MRTQIYCTGSLRHLNVWVRLESGRVICTTALKGSPCSRWPWPSTRFHTTLNSPLVVLPLRVVRGVPLVETHSME